MDKLETIVRYLLAAMLAVIGADKFLHFLEQPEPPADGGRFLGALVDTGYLFPTIGVVFLAASACLLTKRVALATLLMAPITLNILLYHFRYDLPGTGPGAVITAMQLLLMWRHRVQLGSLLLRNPLHKG